MEPVTLETLSERLAVVEAGVSHLVSVVNTLISGMQTAQSAPGMAGMMARQMLPDLSTLPSNVA